MKIAFTGCSSFTGLWFIKTLVTAGHDVTAFFQSSLDSYQGVRRIRVDQLLGLCRCEFSQPFGSENFLNTLNEEPHWDLFCHHAADVTDYKSQDFNIAEAVKKNTWQLKSVLESLSRKHCKRIILTGSIFEPGEGAGSEGLPAFSPYGISKNLTATIFRYFCPLFQLPLSKFIIPNPFGPYEEPRFTHYLIKSWFEGKIPEVKTPAYVRDNIHVSLLAKAYVYFALHSQLPFEKFSPSGYPESQGAFTQRFANEMRKRLSLPCEYSLATQTEFSEPTVRIGTEVLDGQRLKWDEDKAWDHCAHYYQQSYQMANVT